MLLNINNDQIEACATETFGQACDHPASGAPAGSSERSDFSDIVSLAQFAEAVPGFMIVLCEHPDGRMTVPFVSPGLAEIYGLRREDIRDDDSPFRAATHQDDLGDVLQAIEVARLEGTPLNIEYRIRTPHKGERWIEIHARATHEPDRYILWHGFIRDITERKSMEAALRESEQRYCDIFEHTSDNIFLYDVTPSGRFMLTGMNGAAERIVGGNWV